ncbi:hypothetical protein Tco_0126797 [Tanacetum coccineum]
MSVEIVSSGLVPLRTKRFQIMTTMKPVPQDKMFGSSAEKIDSSQQGLEFLFSPLLEEYYNPTHGLAMADSAMDRSNADDIHQFRQTNVWELVDKLLARWLFKLKWLWKRTNCCALWKQFGLFVAHADYKSFHIYHDGRKTHFLMVHEGRGLLVSGRDTVLGDQLVSWRFNETKRATAMSSAVAEYVERYLQGSSAQVMWMGETGHGLKFMDSNYNKITVVLTILDSHSNLMQSRTTLSYKAHPYSVSLHKGTGNSAEAVDAGLVVTESSGTKPEKQDTSSSSGNYTTQAVDADIGPVNDDEPFAKVQLTALHNIFANEQQHTEQSEPNYDTHLLETTIDSNTTPTSTNMCHRGGEIDQDALLKTELLKTKDMVDKEIYNELSKRFLQLEKHCISLEIQIQQKEESFQSNKPCKNQEFPEFREFFVINDLKAQLLARTTLICNLKKQIKSVKETSNEAKVKNNLDVIETINIELEHNVTKLLAANEQLHKENEHLKQTYQELFDSIKKKRIQNKDNSES